MQPTNFKDAMSKGHAAFGSIVTMPAPELVEILGLAHYDFVMIDMEHTSLSAETVSNLIRAADAVGIVPLVRVLKNDEGLILRVLDAGSHGIIVPHVRNKEDALRAVKAAKYPPEGSRGGCPRVRSAKYASEDWASYQSRANSETMVIPIIEDKSAADNIEEILSVEGVDAVFLGPFDLSIEMGLKGQLNHQEVWKLLDKIITACSQQQMPIMHIVLNPEEVEVWFQKGVRLFIFDVDCRIYGKACKNFIQEIQKLSIK